MISTLNYDRTIENIWILSLGDLLICEGYICILSSSCLFGWKTSWYRPVSYTPNSSNYYILNPPSLYRKMLTCCLLNVCGMLYVLVDRVQVQGLTDDVLYFWTMQEVYE